MNLICYNTDSRQQTADSRRNNSAILSFSNIILDNYVHDHFFIDRGFLFLLH